MKTLSILAALVISASSHTSANAEQPQGLYAGDAGPVVVAQSTATRHKFNSRRGYRNPAVHNKKEYKADDAWEGATIVKERENKATKRLNRQFKSKRSHMNYQFD